VRSARIAQSKIPEWEQEMFKQRKGYAGAERALKKAGGTSSRHGSVSVVGWRFQEGFGASVE
jgi:hypothetical protein